MDSEIIQKVRAEVKNTVEKFNMFKGVKKIVVAFSSGPDSVCLLDVLHALYKDGIKFYLVYINHGLRPARYLKIEENLTAKYALKYGVRHSVIKVKVKRGKIGIEAAARNRRYNALLTYMKKIGAQRIAFGHNLDDLLETFFMNLLRGSGTRGLSAIPAVRLPFVRPLINVKKQEVLRFLKSKKLSYSFDRTNIKLSYRRNLIRNKIIPQLIKINPDIYNTVKREIEILKQDDDYLGKLADKIYNRVASIGTNHIALDIKRIMRYNFSIRSRVVMKAIKALRGNLDGFESKHYEAVFSLTDKESSKKISLPKGLFAQRAYGDIVIGRVKRPRNIRVRVNIDGDAVVIGNYVVKTRSVSRIELKKTEPNCELFDHEKLSPPLFIRNRKAGDFIETKVGKKKMKKIFNEFKIPEYRRNDLLILCDQKGMLWILGYMRAFRGFTDEKTKNILKVCYEYTD